MKREAARARFDQQPVEANAMVEACVEAFNITRDKSWFDNAVMCFNWFLGHNDLNMPLYDPKTGGCRDGLMADGINQNEGAESSLAWLLSLITLQKLYTDEVLKQPASSKIRLMTVAAGSLPCAGTVTINAFVQAMLQISGPR